MKKPILLMPFVISALVFGIYTGLLRMGWQFPVTPGLGEHGAMMIGSFLGTLIIIERVVTMNNRWIYMIPLVNAHSLVFFLLDRYIVSYWLLVIGSLGLVAIMAYYAYRFKDYHNYIMLIGALCLFIGNLFLLIISKYPQSTTWWIAFFLLTITGERLELTRYLPVSKNKKLLLMFLLFTFLLGIILPFHIYGKYISSASLILIAGWLLMYDIAMKSVKKEGMFRYSALLLITGYFWLFVTSAFFVVNSDSNFIYDAALHTFFIGFVFSMIFAHAPIILPGITGMNIKPFHITLYIWFVLLQVSLILRISGDVLTDMQIRQYGGILNGIAIIGFFVNMAMVVIVQIKKIKNPILKKLY